MPTYLFGGEKHFRVPTQIQNTSYGPGIENLFCNVVYDKFVQFFLTDICSRGVEIVVLMLRIFFVLKCFQDQIL